MALLNASQLVAEIANTVKFAIIVLGVLLAVLDRSPNRGFWIGFAICGVAYHSVMIDEGLPTRLGRYLYEKIPEPEEPNDPRAVEAADAADWVGTGFDDLDSHFASVFYAIMSVLMAFVGGVVGQYLGHRAERQKQNAQDAKHPQPLGEAHG